MCRKISGLGEESGQEIEVCGGGEGRIAQGSANGMAGEVGTSVCGNNSDGGTHETGSEGSERRVDVENDFCRIGSLDGGDHAEGAAFGRVIGGIENVVEGRFYICGGERAAVMKANSGAQMEDVGQRIGKVPGFGEVAVQVHLFIALEEGGEEQAVDVLGLRVGGVAGVEVGGVGFDEEGEGVWIGMVGMGTAREKRSNEAKK